MFRNYVKVAVRSLLKRKAFTLINILGLAMGMAVCLLIVLFIRSELGYDNFHQHGDRIYRMVLDRKYPEHISSYAIIPASFGPAMQREFPEVEVATGLQDFSGPAGFFVKVGDKTFEERHALIADSNFFRVFTVDMLQGDTATALARPDMAVINESTAIRYFGSVSKAMGQYFETDGRQRFTISGVCKDWPENSHLDFDILVSLGSFPFSRTNQLYRFQHFHLSPAAQRRFPRCTGSQNSRFGTEVCCRGRSPVVSE
jgi:putative ABC transport system permease protein